MRFPLRLAGVALCTVAALVSIPSAAVANDARQDRHLGGQIIFSSSTTDGVELFTLRPDGTHLRQLTHVDGYDVIHPDWSADGRLVVFQLDSPTEALLGTIRADGTGFRVLPITAPFVGQPSFTPDGRRVVFERFDGVAVEAIYSATLDGRNQRQLTFPPAGYGDTEPNVSPDGRTLSVVRLGPAPTDAALVTINLRTGVEHQLTTFDADVAIKTGWSPNSRRIVFTRDAFTGKPGISPNIWTTGRYGHAQRAVTHFRGGDVAAIAGSYSPDGRWIVFRRAEPSGAGLWMIRPNGRHARLIFHDPQIVPRYIDWGPRPR